MATARRFGALLVLHCLSACASAGDPGTEGAADGPEATVAVGFYSEDQAQRGRQVWRAVCRECHFLSEVRGRAFNDSWSRRTLRDLYRAVTRTMPDDNPGSLEVQEYLDVVAYILQLNRFPAGPNELQADEEAMRALRLEPVAASGNSP